MEEAAAGDLDWLTRMATGTNYPAGDDVLEVAKEAYLRFFSTNGLLPGTFPSLARFERDVIDYAAGLFHGPDAVGSITSGGSESILMGVKSARDRARRLHPEITRPHMVVPEFGASGVHQGGRLLRAGRDARPARCRLPDRPSTPIRAAITDDTVLLVASAPEPDPRHGRPDRGARAARGRARTSASTSIRASAASSCRSSRSSASRCPGSTSGCPGVTTISADLHKFGYTAKGASLIMSRDRDVFEHQPFRFGGGSRPDDWYVTPSMTGTRPGGAIAAAWAVMTYLGEAGYLDRTRRTLDYLHRWWAAIEAIDGLHIMGKPAMSVFAVASPTLDMYAVGKGMEDRGWIVYMDSEPVPSLRFMQSPGHEPYVDAYMADLREVVEDVRSGALTTTEGRANYT